MLANSRELSVHLNDPQWVIFDCRHDLLDKAKGEQLYREGHIPGAHFANVETDLAGEKTGLNGRHPLPSPAAFAGFLARHGVAQNAMVVIHCHRLPLSLVSLRAMASCKIRWSWLTTMSEANMRRGCGGWRDGSD